MVFEIVVYATPKQSNRSMLDRDASATLGIAAIPSLANAIRLASRAETIFSNEGFR